MHRFLYLDQDGAAKFTTDAWKGSCLNGEFSGGKVLLGVLRSFFGTF